MRPMHRLLLVLAFLPACAADDFHVDGDLTLHVALREASGTCVDSWGRDPLIVHAPAGGPFTTDLPAVVSSGNLTYEAPAGHEHFTVSIRDRWSVASEDDATVETEVSYHLDVTDAGAVTGTGDGQFDWQ